MPNSIKLTPEEFILRAVERLRTPHCSKGIHNVYSGFDAAFRDYFPFLDPTMVLRQLAEEGRIILRPARGGVIVYKPEDAPVVYSGKSALEKILEEPKQEEY